MPYKLNKTSPQHRYLTYNLHWQEQGWDFEEILQVRNQLKDDDPFLSADTLRIQEFIGKEKHPYKDIPDFEKLEFLYIDDSDFNGNLDFLELCPNLKHLYILGISVKVKICDLTPVKILNQLEYLSLEYHQITNLKPIQNLENLRELYLCDNPLETIKPICGFSRVKKLELPKIPEYEVFQILENSTEAEVSYINSYFDYGFTAFWIDNWAYHSSYIKDYLQIENQIAPLMPTAFYIKPRPTERLKKKLSQIAHSHLRASEYIGNSSFEISADPYAVSGYFKYAKYSKK